MLVLSRKTDEQIIIGDGVTITVLRIDGRKVKLGIQAGDDVKIVRAELAESCSAHSGGLLPDHERIADPTAGLASDPAGEQPSSRPAGSDHPGSGWIDPRPAWLTICCCS